MEICIFRILDLRAQILLTIITSVVDIVVGDLYGRLMANCKWTLVIHNNEKSVPELSGNDSSDTLANTEKLLTSRIQVVQGSKQKNCNQIRSNYLIKQPLLQRISTRLLVLLIVHTWPSYCL